MGNKELKTKRWTSRELAKQKVRRADYFNKTPVTLPTAPWKKYDRPDYIKNTKT